MNPDSKLLLDEMHRLFNEQKTQIEDQFAKADWKLDSCFTNSSRLLEQRFAEVDESVTKRLADVDDSLNKRVAEPSKITHLRRRSSSTRH